MAKSDTFDSIEENYLKTELYDLVQKDPLIFDFIQDAFLDGIWYWDLQNTENEWMSDKFWSTFGYDPTTKKPLASEWQDMIVPEDLLIAQRNFEKHLKDPSFPYDQVVRYRHKNGSIVWVRCRGIALYDHEGNASRLLGAHTDITAIMKRQQQLLREQLHKRELSKELDVLNFKYEDLQHKNKFLEKRLQNMALYDEVTNLLTLDGLYQLTKTLIMSSARLNVDVNLFSFKIENHNYIQKHYMDSEIRSKLAKLNSLFKETIVDMELASVGNGYIFGISIGYSVDEISKFVELMERHYEECEWSIVKPILKITTLRKTNVKTYTLDTLKSWLIEL